MSDCYVNGTYVGMVENPEDFVQQIRNERRKGVISSQVNVYLHGTTKDVHVDSTPGRVRRPLIVVKEGKPLLTEQHIRQLAKNELSWNDLVEQGVIELIDAGEEENCLVAFYDHELTAEHTHRDISPAIMMGYCTSLVPFGNFTQPARLMIGSKNQKQSLGLYTANYPLKMEMDVSVLQTPQNPVVKTIMHDISKYETHAAGQNVVIAVMSYKGYNMDDSVIINKGSIERGLGRSSYFRQYVAEELRYSGGLVDQISVPDKDVKGYKSERDYRLLEEDGIVFPEAKVAESDVVIGKTSPPRFLSGLDEYNLAASTRRESSVSLAHGEDGVVDFILVTENDEGNKLVQIRTRTQKIPEIGDKYTSRHGQKGVIGLIVPETDMPFSESGHVPDLIFSPHGIPSRMTISHLLELVGAKVGALAGRYVDATPFSAETESDLRKELTSLGFRENGFEVLYNGETGEMIPAKIFIGSMYYLKLKHMVSNKMHARARGPIQLLTRQPTEGRAKEGGLRLGEMEKDTFIAHGTSLLLKERFDSDRTIVPVCEQCGIIAVYDEYKRRTYCPACGENTEINNIELSYAFKLMLDELKALCLYPQLVLEDKY